MKPETLGLMAIAIDPEAFDAGLPNWRYWSSRRKSAIKKAEDASEKAPSISFAFKRAESDEDEQPRQSSKSKPDFDDDIPF